MSTTVPPGPSGVAYRARPRTKLPLCTCHRGAADNFLSLRAQLHALGRDHRPLPELTQPMVNLDTNWERQGRWEGGAGRGQRSETAIIHLLLRELAAMQLLFRCQCSQQRCL